MNGLDSLPDDVAQYTLGEKLGGGGQGVVYRAFDTRLERTVALKFLPPHLTLDPDAKERFTVEARAAASLDHPNICTIHEIGEIEVDPGREGTRLFIVMPLYVGETVKSKVAHGPLEPDLCIDIALQTARGLQRSHDGGIVHRDVKPGNVLVTTDGTVKILDFGIAKLSDLTLTRTGMTMGTVAYMSPEQARGEAVDARTDIWSLGVVLYEMATGQMPFNGGHEQAILYSILHEPPTPVTELRSGLPEGLPRVIGRALEKEPDRRYDDMASMIRDLESLLVARPGTPADGAHTWRRPLPIALAAVGSVAFVATIVAVLSGPEADLRPGTAPGARPSVDGAVATDGLRRLVVLPFSNLRNDPETDYLGYAVADQIIGALSNFQNLAVRPSAQIRQYVGQQIDPLGVGGQLGTDFVLTGGFLKVEDDIRLNIELLDVNSDVLIWRQDIAVAFESAFALQDMVADSVIRGLEVQFSDVERARVGVDVPSSALAYEYFLRSRALNNVTGDNRLALDLITQSLAIDSLFAPAHVELGRRYYWLAAHQLQGFGEYLARAEDAFTRALALNPEQLDALWMLVIVYQETARGPEAYPLARRMLEISPNSAEAHQALSYLFRQAGLLEEARASADRALDLDAASTSAQAMAAIAYYYLGDHDVAIRHLGPPTQSSFVEWWKARIHFAAGRPDSAVHYLDRTLVLDSEGFFASSAMSMKGLIEGDLPSARATYRARQDSDQTDGEVWYVDAQEGALLGETESALRALENAIRWGFFSYPLIARDALLNPIRDEPEFPRILDDARVKHEAFRSLVEGS